MSVSEAKCETWVDISTGLRVLLDKTEIMIIRNHFKPFVQSNRVELHQVECRRLRRRRRGIPLFYIYFVMFE